MIEYGTVEDIFDPLDSGRCKVRVDGIHSKSKQDIPTEELPWATSLHPITSAAYRGVGYGGCGVVVGSRVLVVFKDPGSYQQPIMLGTLPALYAGTEGSIIAPANDGTPRESDLGRLATGNLTEDTIVQQKRDGRLDMSTDVISIVEPDVPYAAKYPYNQTYVTPAGHVVEYDDTEGAERIHIYHKSGTFVEMHPDGAIVYKTKGDEYRIIEGNNITHTSGNITDFTQGNVTREVVGNVMIHIVGNKTVKIDGDYNVDVAGNATLNVGGSYNVTAASNIDVTAGGNYTEKATKISMN